jgi:hypothetical protein
MFLIPIRNRATGEEKNFFGLRAIAEFLLERDDFTDWTGWEFAGALPELAPVVAKAEGIEPATKPIEPEAAESAPTEPAAELVAESVEPAAEAPSAPTADHGDTEPPADEPA